MRGLDEPVQVFMAIMGWFLIVVACFFMGAGAAYITGIETVGWLLFIVLSIGSSALFGYSCFPGLVDDWIERRRIKAAERMGIDPEEVKTKRRGSHVY